MTHLETAANGGSYRGIRSTCANMPLLLYCISKSASAPRDLPDGVAGSPVFRVDVDSLAAFVSRESDSASWLQASLRTSALEFHQVVKEVFQSTTVVPFRFPTIFENDEQLAKHMGVRSSEYNSQLEKFANCAQMELRISYSADRASPSSGVEYLRRRQKALHEAELFESELKTALSPVSRQWRQRAGSNGVRTFALVKRERVREFEERMRGIGVRAGIDVRVTGPWPVSEFLEAD